MRGIIQNMRQLYRMYRFVKIVDAMEVETDINNEGKDLVYLIENGFKPTIESVKAKYRIKHKVSKTVANHTYEDAKKKGYILPLQKLLKNTKNVKEPLKFDHYIETSPEGRTLIDSFIIPWGLIKAYFIEYGLVVTTLISLGIGALAGTTLKLLWSILKGVI